MDAIKANARIWVEQVVDLVLKKLKLKILSQPHDEVLLATNRRYKRYEANDARIILKNGLLFSKFYGEASSVKCYQSLLPEQLVDGVLRTLHGAIAKPP